MLSQLSIRNVAIIDRLQLSFGPGLNILSGETGAGKSIIIDALTLASGGRASVDLIRSGEDEAVVEALFDLADQKPLQRQLQEAGFQDTEELLIKRCLSRTGKNRIYINGSLATLAQLGEIGRQLVTIHGQHESQGLLRPEYHLELLDVFAGAEGMRRDVAGAFARWRETEQQLDRFEEQGRALSQRMELLAHQVEELEEAQLRPGEDEELEEQRRVLANAERLAMTAGGAYEALYGGDRALLGELKRIVAAVREAAGIDASLASVQELLDEGYLQLEDGALQLRDYTARLEAEPDRLRMIEDRLDLLQRLKRKHASTLDGLIEQKSALKQELDQLQGQYRSREQLQQEAAELREALHRLAAELGTKRVRGAQELEQRLTGEIRQLAMPHAVVRVALESLAEPRSSGLERVEFLFSPNPGEPPRPLARVASGGELSRLMLAFKQVLPEGEAPTLVFDEVDSGIGGSVAGVVGRKLRHLADAQQVFCVTHLPQVASWSTRHLRVEKRVLDGRTVTAVRELDHEGQVQELARMLAGEQITAAALQHAEEMLRQAVGR